MTTETISSYVKTDFADRSREAEQLLREVATEGRTELLTSERAYLARELGWDATEITKQLRRVNSILRLQSIAGRPEDREAALQECQTATDLLAKQGPKIEEKIDKLRAELAGLERDATTSAKRVEAQGQAVEQLRSHCPVDIAERVKTARKIVESTIGADLRNAKSRHHELRCILNIDNVYASPEKHLESLQRLLPAGVSKTVDSGKMIRLAYSPQWVTLKAECQVELDELTARLPELQAEYDAAVQQAELPLDYYSDPKNQEND